jgi:hypothetical protein
MNKLLFCALLIFFFVTPTIASDQEDAAADAIASAFFQARETAHFPKLGRMGRNTFRTKVCKQDLRFPKLSDKGMIDNVNYQTSDPAHLPESAQKLATTPNDYRIRSRFALGVCSLKTSSEHPEYSVFIATYESRWTSFWRIFQE